MSIYIGLALAMLLVTYVGWLVGMVMAWKMGDQIYRATKAELDEAQAQLLAYREAPALIASSFRAHEEAAFIQGNKSNYLHFRKQGKGASALNKSDFCRLYDVPEDIVGDPEPRHMNVNEWPPLFHFWGKDKED